MQVCTDPKATGSQVCVNAEAEDEEQDSRGDLISSWR